MLNELILAIVKRHYKVRLGVSCLVPVKEFLTKAYTIDVSQSNFIFELLPVLIKEGLIAAVWELNLSKKIDNDVFEMIKYTQDDVANCVAALNRKDKFSC